MIRHGVRPVQRDRRDYDFHRTFRAGGTGEMLLMEYTYDAGICVPNQNAEFAPFECTAYTVCDIALDQDAAAARARLPAPTLERYFPGYTYMQTMLEMGSNGVDLNGADVRKAFGSAGLAGVLKVSDSPFQIGGGDEAFIANYKNWPLEANTRAAHNRRPPYFMVKKQSGMDWFDSIRAALRLQADTKTSIGIVTPWFREWNNPQQGVIPEVMTGDPRTLPWHAWKICGESTILDEPHLIAKTWQGNAYGLGGYSYYSRATINAALAIYGTAALTFRHPGENDIKTSTLYGFQTILELISKFLSFWNRS